jgi:hypothetical protein
MPADDLSSNKCKCDLSRGIHHRSCQYFTDESLNAYNPKPVELPVVSFLVFQQDARLEEKKSHLIDSVNDPEVLSEQDYLNRNNAFVSKLQASSPSSPTRTLQHDNNDKKDNPSEITVSPPSLSEELYPVFNLAPEACYVAFISLNDLSKPETLGFNEDQEGLFHLSDDFNKYGAQIGWDYFDGLCSILAGIALIKQGKTKEGALSIANGLQLIGTSWSFGLYKVVGCSSTVMAPITFAVCMAIDLYNTTKELYEAAMEADIESWFELKANLVNEINEKLVNSPDDKKKRELEKQKTHALIEMGCRYRASKGIIDTTTGRPLTEKLSAKINLLTNAADRANMQSQKEASCSAKDVRVNNLIQKAANKRYTALKVNLPFKLLSFVGMTFAAAASIAALGSFAAPPIGLAIAATIICTIVAAYYLTKFGYIASNYKENKKNAKELESHKLNVFKESKYTLFPFSKLRSEEKGDNDFKESDLLLKKSGSLI